MLAIRGSVVLGEADRGVLHVFLDDSEALLILPWPCIIIIECINVTLLSLWYILISTFFESEFCLLVSKDILGTSTKFNAYVFNIIAFTYLNDWCSFSPTSKSNILFLIAMILLFLLRYQIRRSDVNIKWVSPWIMFITLFIMSSSIF